MALAPMDNDRVESPGQIALGIFYKWRLLCRRFCTSRAIIVLESIVEARARYQLGHRLGLLDPDLFRK